MTKLHSVLQAGDHDLVTDNCHDPARKLRDGVHSRLRTRVEPSSQSSALAGAR